MTSCFTLASAANRIPTRSYLIGLNRKTLVPILSNGLETVYGARIGEVKDDHHHHHHHHHPLSPPTVIISRLVIRTE